PVPHWPRVEPGQRFLGRRAAADRRLARSGQPLEVVTQVRERLGRGDRAMTWYHHLGLEHEELAQCLRPADLGPMDGQRCHPVDTQVRGEQQAQFRVPERDIEQRVAGAEDERLSAAGDVQLSYVHWLGYPYLQIGEPARELWHEPVKDGDVAQH